MMSPSHGYHNLSQNRHCRGNRGSGLGPFLQHLSAAAIARSNWQINWLLLIEFPGQMSKDPIFPLQVDPWFRIVKWH
jgi:hypothetical protein